VTLEINRVTWVPKMSQQGSVVVVSDGLPLSAALSATDMFPVVDATWAEAMDAVAHVDPAAVVVSVAEKDGPHFSRLATAISARRPYLPLIVINPAGSLPGNAIPLALTNGSYDRLGARLQAALRVRTLHATVLRRLNCHPTVPALPETDALDDATVLLIGRGAGYAALSVALGERIGVVGALSIEAAAKHLNTRDIDGIVLGEGFSPRVVDAFLIVLAEDTRFRMLPIVVTAPGMVADYDLPNLEFGTGEPADIAANAMPLIRQRAFETRLARVLSAIDSNGLLDPRSGLLTPDAFNRDIATAVYQTSSRGGSLTAARLSFDEASERARLDAARILSRLMRKIDFATMQSDGSIVVVFAETDLRNAQLVTKRLSSVMKHTMHGADRHSRIDPHITMAALLPDDSAKALLDRLHGAEVRSVAS
jgi:hypothetical protein